MANQQSIARKIITSKAAIYVRVSTHWQVDKDSLAVQQRELVAYCQLVLNINDYVIFEDAGYSAKNTERPSLQDMMSRIRAGEFSHVLVWKIDRISRNLLDFASMYAELQELGVTFISKNEQFDTSTAIGEAMLKIILVFAELERKMTSERVSAVMLSRANNGQWNGGRVPYGYVHAKGEPFQLSQSEAPIVKRIFDLYESCRSCAHIADVFNKEGLVTKSGNMWSTFGIHKILTNPFYYGAYRYNIRNGTNGPFRDQSEWVTVGEHHPPIISKEQFDRVQYILTRNKRGGNEKGIWDKNKRQHIFSGLIVCGNCGCSLTASPGTKRADGWIPSNYVCSRKRKSTSSCDSKYITDATLAPFILNLVSNIIAAKGETDANMTADILERKLLSGPVFSGVSHITKSGLNALLEALRNDETVVEYKASFASDDDAGTASFLNSLMDQRRKKELALRRLKSVFLYGEQEFPQSDFIRENKQLMDDIERIDQQIEDITDSEVTTSALDKAFIEKSSYFIMVEHILSADKDDPMSFIRAVDTTVVKTFVKAIIRKIVVTGGQITEVQFRNGLSLEFNY